MPHPMTDIVRCPNCGQANRLPEGGKKAVCGKCKTPLTGGHLIDVTDANFVETIRRRAFVVAVRAAWCGPCRMIAPVIEELATSRTDARFAKLNVDQSPRTASAYRAMSIPLLVLFKDGTEKGRAGGAVPRTQIEAATRQS